MGCGSSRSAVAPAPQLGPQPRTAGSEERSQATVQHGEAVERQSSSTSIGSKKSVKIRQNNVLPKTANESLSVSSVIKVQEAELHNQSNGESDSSQYSSRDSIHINTRLVSAYSTQSKASQDSGLGEEYAHIITEGSDSTTKEVANLRQGMEAPNLTIEGEKIKTPSLVGHRRRLPPIQPVKGHTSSSNKSISPPPPPLSLTASKRVTFSKDLDELPDSPSIIKRPCSRGGLAFDIVLDESAADPAIRKKPIHLKKLEQKRGAVSHEELDEKLRAAEQRRKEQSQMLLERLRAKQEKDRQVAEALAKFAAMQAEIKNGVIKKVEETTEKREAYLKTMRDRLREKSQRVEEVKMTKKMAQEKSIPSPQSVTVAN